MSVDNSKLKGQVDKELRGFRIKKLNEAKYLKIKELNAELALSGIIELTPSNGGVKLMGDDDQLLLACEVIDYQTEVRDFTKGTELQLMGIDGEEYDVKAKGKLIIVNNYDTYLSLLEDYMQ